MNKTDIANVIYDSASNNGARVTRAAARAIADEILSQMHTTLLLGGDVRLENIGTLHCVAPRKFTKSSLPHLQGKPLPAPKPSVRLRASRVIREALAGE